MDGLAVVRGQAGGAVVVDGGEAGVAGVQVAEAAVEFGRAVVEPAGDVGAVAFCDVHDLGVVGGEPAGAGGAHVVVDGGGLGGELEPVGPGVGGGAASAFGVGVGVAPAALDFGLVVFGGEVAEDVEAFFGGEGNVVGVGVDGAFDVGDELVEALGFAGEELVLAVEVGEVVGVGVVEDVGDLFEGEAEFAVEEDLLEAEEVFVGVAAVAGGGALAGGEEGDVVVVVEGSYGDAGQFGDLADGQGHGSDVT